MNRVLIDTDILSYFFKGDKTVISNVEKYLQSYELIEISLITYYEVVGGLLAKNALKQLKVFLAISLIKSSEKLSWIAYFKRLACLRMNDFSSILSEFLPLKLVYSGIKRRVKKSAFYLK